MPNELFAPNDPNAPRTCQRDFDGTEGETEEEIEEKTEGETEQGRDEVCVAHPGLHRVRGVGGEVEVALLS